MKKAEMLMKDVKKAIVENKIQVEYPTSYSTQNYNSRLSYYHKQLEQLEKFEEAGLADEDELGTVRTIIYVLINSKIIAQRNNKKYNDIVKGIF